MDRSNTVATTLHPPGGVPAQAAAGHPLREAAPAKAPRRSLADWIADLGPIPERPDSLDADAVDGDALAQLMADTDAALAAIAEADPEGTLLAAQIDRDLGQRVWNGTTVEDRLGRLDTTLTRSLQDELEKSLMSQESYDEFEQRMLNRLGVGSIEPRTGGKAVVAMETTLENEARLGWNEGLLAANQQEDTILVWAAVLDDRTTPGCWDNHGLTQDEVGDDSIPAHERCRCRWLVVPNPESEDAEWARMGQDILAEMAEEREQGSATDSPTMQEAASPCGRSRFRALRDGSGPASFV